MNKPRTPYTVMTVVQKDFRAISDKDKRIIEKELANDANLSENYSIDDMQEDSIALYYENELCGFYSPHSVFLNGKTYFRCFPLYIFLKYRRKGIANHVIGNFYLSHKGYVWIDDENTESIDFHTQLGFAVCKKQATGHFYTNDRLMK